MKKIILLAATALTACGTPPPVDPNYIAYLNAGVSKQQKPLVEIKAQSGQQITGLESITVYAPEAADKIAAPTPYADPWARVAETGLSILGNLGNSAIVGHAAVGLATQLKEAGTAGYARIQAPGAVTTVSNSYNTSSSQSSVADSNNTATTNTTNTNTSNTTLTGSQNPVTNPVVPK